MGGINQDTESLVKALSVLLPVISPLSILAALVAPLSSSCPVTLFNSCFSLEGIVVPLVVLQYPGRLL